MHQPLPNPRHATRLPPHIGKDELARIRHSAYNLPQVVKPADYALDEGQNGEQQLDQLGFVMLQKGVAGQRPSRWIDPRLMDAALAHLDAFPAGAPLRPALLERTNQLHGLGVSRTEGNWTRLTRHTLKLDEIGWPGAELPVHYHALVDEAPVWAFYRSGDLDALRAAIGTPMPYPYATAFRWT